MEESLNKENILMLVEENTIDVYYIIKTNLNYEQLQEIIKEHKESNDLKSFSVDDVKKLIILKGYTCEILDAPYVYY